MERHALAASYREHGMWTFVCSCGKQWQAFVRDDAGARFERHQDSYAPSRWDIAQDEVPMIPGHEDPCVMCGALLFIIGDKDAVCRRCEDADPFWNQL